MDKAYLGDGVYAEYDGFHVVLTTSNGVVTTNQIFLDPEVWASLQQWVDRVKEERNG